MEPSDVQLLVHVSASCATRDDQRYRKEAHNLLSFLAQSRAIVPIIPVEQRDVSTESPEETRSSNLVGKIVEHDTLATHTPGDVSVWRQTGRIKQGMIRSRSDAAIDLRKTPELDAAVQVGRTPAVFTRETPLERPKTAPAVIKETPLGPPLIAPGVVFHYDTPPSTVPDSQPSHSSFKRAFMECAAAALHTQTDTPVAPARQRARTAPPVPPWYIVGDSCGSSRSESALDISTLRPLKRGFGLDGHTSSPSPPKRRKTQPEQQRLPSSSNSGMQADAELSSSMSGTQPMIHEDEDADTSSFNPIPTSNEHHDPLPLRSSQSSQNRQPSQPSFECDPPPQPNEPTTKPSTHTDEEHIAPAPSQHSLPAAPSASVQRASEVITAPRPATGSSTYRTHLTPALSLVRTKLTPLSKYYAPVEQRRDINALERGCWRLEVPMEWTSDGTRDTFWMRLTEHIRKGRGGFGTWIERRGPGITTSASASASFQSSEGLEVWRVWCWGEVHVEIWLLLYVDSGGKARGVPMRWEDGAGETVVQM